MSSFLERLESAMIPDASELQLQLDAEMGVASTEIYPGYLKAVQNMLEQDPKMYRSFGPWWWSIKSLLNLAGGAWGELDESWMRNKFHYDDKNLICMAACQYQHHRLENAFAWSPDHDIATNDEVLPYSLEDMDMESRIIGA